MKELQKKTVVECGIGFLTARAAMGDFNPIGMAYFASCFVEKRARIPLFIVMTVGMLTKLDYVTTFRYAAVMGLFFLTEWLLQKKKMRIRRREAAWMGSIAAFILAAAQYMFTAHNIYTVGYMLAECVLIAGLTHVFSEAVQYILYAQPGQALDNEEMVSLVLLLTMAVYGIPVDVANGFSLTRFAIYFLLLYMGYCYGAGTGALIGAACGLLTCLTGGENTDLGVLCLMGICAGSFRGMKKTGVCASYIVTNVVLGYLFESAFVGLDGIRELLIAGVFFVCIPGDLIAKADLSVYAVKDSLYYQKNLQAKMMDKAKSVGDAFSNLARSFKEELYTEWRQQPQYYDADSTALSLGWQNRMTETKNIIAEQFEEVADIVKDMAAEICDTEGVETMEEKELSSALLRYNVQIKKCEIIRHKNGRMEVYIRARTDRRTCVTSKEAARIISEAVGVAMRPADDVRIIIPREYEMIRFVEAVNFKVLNGIARTVKCGEETSGDNYSFIDLAGERMVMLLSDGMGSGIDACLESESVVELLEKFMEAGFKEDSAIRLINSMMVLGQERQSFTTVDMTVIDMHTGMCRFIKNGAAATFIKRKEEVEAVYGEALPIGVLKDVPSATETCKLYDGEFIIMVTDGVLDCLADNDKEQTLAQIIAQADTNNAQELAEYILKKVMYDNNTPTDDMTVIVSGIWEAVSANSTTLRSRLG